MKDKSLELLTEEERIFYNEFTQCRTREPLTYCLLKRYNPYQHNMDGKGILNETIIDGSRVFVENGEVKTVLSDEVQKSGYIPLETARQLSIARIKKVISMGERCGSDKPANNFE